MPKRGPRANPAAAQPLAALPLTDAACPLRAKRIAWGGGGARERTQFSPLGGNGGERTLPFPKGSPAEPSGAGRVGKRRRSVMSELSPPGESEGYGACVSDCYSFITTPGNLLQSILGFAKMQNVEHHRSTESRYRYGYWLATVCAPGLLRKMMDHSINAGKPVNSKGGNPK